MALLFNRKPVDPEEISGKNPALSLFNRQPQEIPEGFRFSNDLAVDDAPEPMDLQKPMAAMPKPDMAMPGLDSIDTPETPSPMAPEPKKQGIFSKIMNSFKTQETPGAIDPQTGVEGPSTYKEGLGSKILGVALPALAGMLGGVGVFPGAAIGYASQKGNDAMRVKEEQDAFRKRQADAQKAMAPTTSLKELNEYQKLDPAGQAQWREMKAAGKMIISPLDIARLDLDRQRLTADLTKKGEDAAAKADERAREQGKVAVPGYELTGDVTPLPAEAEKIRGAVGQLNEFTNGIKRLKDYTDQYGTIELAGEGKTKMKSLISGLRLTLKELNNLGAITGPDMAFLESQLDDVNSPGAIFDQVTTGGKGGDLKKAALDELMTQLNARVDARLAASGYRKSAQGSKKTNLPQAAKNVAHPEDAEAIQWAQQNPNDPLAAEILRRNGM